MDAVELGDAGADKHVSRVRMNQVGADQHMQVGGAAEGAVALCGGGESHHVGDRSRADCGGPVQTDVGVVGWVGDEVGVG